MLFFESLNKAEARIKNKAVQLHQFKRPLRETDLHMPKKAYVKNFAAFRQLPLDHAEQYFQYLPLLPAFSISHAGLYPGYFLQMPHLIAMIAVEFLQSRHSIVQGYFQASQKASGFFALFCDYCHQHKTAFKYLLFHSSKICAPRWSKFSRLSEKNQFHKFIDSL